MQETIAESLAAELVRAVRGRRSQSEFSRRLGYRSNIVRRWEARECWPTAAAFLTAHARVRPDAARLYTKFFQRTPDWFDPSRPFGVTATAAFLQQLRGKTPIGVLATRAGFNRYTVGRWLQGTAQPKLPEFLCLIEAASRRVLDFVACITDPGKLPSVAAQWQRLQRARSAAYDSPWSHAVLRALELEGRENVAPALEAAWLGERLGLSEASVQQGLEALDQSGQIRRVHGKWQVESVQAVDTSADSARARELKSSWARVALERLHAGGAGNFGYSLFAVSRKDLRRLRDLHLEYIRAMQTLIAESKPSECVGLYCAQLLDLSSLENALETAEGRPPRVTRRAGAVGTTR